MKEIRSHFNELEYTLLKDSADQYGVSIKQLIRDRALGISQEEKPLVVVQKLGETLGECRDMMNEIIKREICTKDHLYEDDIIRMEKLLTRAESMVADCIAQMIKVGENNGNTSV